MNRFKQFFYLAVAVVAAVAVAGCSRPDSETPLKDMARNMLRGSVKPKNVDTGLPVITITTEGRLPVTSKEDYLDAVITITDPDTLNNYDGPVEIRGRGNTTWTHPKKPFRLKFKEKTRLFGLEEAKNWVLLANYQDPTLLMNTVAFELGLRFGVPFPHHYRHVEVILNGKYEGSYLFTEHNEVAGGRVEINKKTGFFAELDRYYDEEPKFLSSASKLPVMIKSPENMDDEGYELVTNAVNELDEALFSPSFPDNGYRDLIDINDVVDFIMINEITRNVDLQMPGSIYMYRNSQENPAIAFGPLWDFDYGFGEAGTYFENSAGMFFDTEYRSGPGQKFFARFFEDPVFREAYKTRWNEKYAEIAGMTAFMLQMAALLEKSHETNFKVWWWNREDYQKEMEKMTTWYTNRVEYLNQRINAEF
ncbi:MAG: CotH kinase family protein [Treponema sp.]|jgi:spore coat protein CotH|nr:CotH kinase family protein [Treponema sp.]